MRITKTDNKSISGDLIGDIQRNFYTEMCWCMTELPKRELLEQKLHKAVELARKRLEAKKILDKLDND